MSELDSNPGDLTDKLSSLDPILEFDLEIENLPPVERDFSIEVVDSNNLPDARTLKRLLRSFNRVYGKGYQFDELEDRSEYLAAHESGDWISILIKDEKGLPVGHASVINKGDNVAEFGRLFIDPCAQGNGLGRVLTDAQMTIAEELARVGLLDVAVAEPVTSHTSSQRLYDAYDPVTTGYFDRRYTDFFSQGYRESVLRLTIPFTDTIKAEREVFLPASLEPVAREIYGELDCTRTIVTQAEGQCDRTGSREIEIENAEFDAFGIVSLSPASARSPLTVVSDTGTAFSEGAAYVEVRLDITHQDVLNQINALRLAGFYFAALEANPSNDVLVLQRLAPGEDAEVSPHVKSFYSKNADELVAALDGTRWSSSESSH